MKNPKKQNGMLLIHVLIIATISIAVVAFFINIAAGNMRESRLDDMTNTANAVRAVIEECVDIKEISTYHDLTQCNASDENVAIALASYNNVELSIFGKITVTKRFQGIDETYVLTPTTDISDIFIADNFLFINDVSRRSMSQTQRVTWFISGDCVEQKLC